PAISRNAFRGQWEYASTRSDVMVLVMACWPSAGFAGPASSGRARVWGNRPRPGRRQGVSTSGHRLRNRSTPTWRLRPHGPLLVDPPPPAAIAAPSPGPAFAVDHDSAILPEGVLHSGQERDSPDG